MSDEPCVKLFEGPVSRLVLCNPTRRNALTRSMRPELVQKIEALNRNPEVRAVVLTGEGKHFNVGADLTGAGAGTPTRLENRERMKDDQAIFHAIANAPKPYVAAVGGDAFGMGMAIAVGCDFVIGGPEARFGTAFARIGGYPELGIATTLANRVGVARAKRLLMLAEHVHAREALEIGLLDQLVEGDHVEAAMEFAELFVRAPPMSVAYVKSTYSGGIPTVADAIRMELDIVPSLMGVTEDAREGIAAFREKRPPKFTGR